MAHVRQMGTGSAMLRGPIAQKFFDAALMSLANSDGPRSVDDPTTDVKRASDIASVLAPLDGAERLEPTEQAKLEAIVAGAPDPFALVKGDVDKLTENVKGILGSKHQVLETVAQYFFEMDSGKKMRPVIVLLVSAAVNSHCKAAGLTSEALTNDPDSRIHAKQCRLAEITEMIHTASLLHDDVLDMADTRRGAKSVNYLFGNKLAVLAGDFLLARASVCLARLRNLEVIETLSTVIEHLVKGEILQMAGLNGHRPIHSDEDSVRCFVDYTAKNYYKTGSLIANSCKSAAMLTCDDPEVHASAFAYGMHFGTAFQLIDDTLDFEGSLSSLGKAPLADVRSGLTTAPVLFAQRQFPELTPLISRKFESSGDVEKVKECVERSGACDETKRLATAHAELAMRAILTLRQSPERDALAKLVHIATHRSS